MKGYIITISISCCYVPIAVWFSSAAESSFIEGITGLLSFTLVTLTVILELVEFAPSLAVTVADMKYLVS